MADVSEGESAESEDAKPKKRTATRKATTSANSSSPKRASKSAAKTTKTTAENTDAKPKATTSHKRTSASKPAEKTSATKTAKTAEKPVRARRTAGTTKTKAKDSDTVAVEEPTPEPVVETTPEAAPEPVATEPEPVAAEPVEDKPKTAKRPAKVKRPRPRTPRPTEPVVDLDTAPAPEPEPEPTKPEPETETKTPPELLATNPRVRKRKPKPDPFKPVVESPIVLPPATEPEHKTAAASLAQPDATYEPWPESPKPSPSITEDTEKLDPEIALGTKIATDESPSMSAKERAFSIRHYIAALSLVCFAMGLTVGVVVGASTAGDGSEPVVVTGPSRPPANIPQLDQPPVTPNPQSSPDQQSTSSPPSNSPASNVPAQTSSSPGPGVISRLNGGSGPTQSGVFQLPGGPVKVRYQTTGSGLTVRLLQQAGRDGDSFYCPTACSREAAIEKPAGEYYLNVDARAGAWTVEVSQ